MRSITVLGQDGRTVEKEPNWANEPTYRYTYQSFKALRTVYHYEINEQSERARASVTELEHKLKDDKFLQAYIHKYYNKGYLDGQTEADYLWKRSNGILSGTETIRSWKE